jgi:hypothetical protein
VLAPFALACAGLGPGASLLLPALWLSGKGGVGGGGGGGSNRFSSLLLRASGSRLLPLAALLLIGLVWTAAEAATATTWAQARALVWPFAPPSRLFGPAPATVSGSGSVFLRWAAVDALVGTLIVLPWLAYRDARLRLGQRRGVPSRRGASRTPQGATVGGGGASAAAVAAGAAATVRLLQESAPSVAVAVCSAAVPLLGPCLYALMRPQLVFGGGEAGEGGAAGGLWLGQRLFGARLLPALQRSARWAGGRAARAMHRGGGGASDEEEHETGGFEDEDESSELSGEGEQQHHEEEEEGEGEAGGAAAGAEEEEEHHAEEEEEEEEKAAGPVVAGHVLRRRRGPQGRA